MVAAGSLFEIVVLRKTSAKSALASLNAQGLSLRSDRGTLSLTVLSDVTASLIHKADQDPNPQKNMMFNFRVVP